MPVRKTTVIAQVFHSNPRRCAATLVLMLIAALGAAACSLFVSPTSSAVGQGLRYESGHEEFDRFFSDLHRLQVAVAEAPDRERAIRAKLAQALGVKGGATIGILAPEVRKRTLEISKADIKTKLEVEGYAADDPLDTAAILRVSGGELSGPQQQFAESVVRASRSELTLMAELRRDARQLEKLLAISTLLEDSVDSAFRVGGPTKRAEVQKNLEDAKKLIPLMVVSARDVADHAPRVVRALEDAITTDRGIGSRAAPPLIVSEPVPEPEAAPPDPPDPKPRPRAPSSSKRPAPKPAAPAARPSGGSDFEP